MAVIFAMNIGASAAAAAMGSVYGARVLIRRTALLLVGIFSLLGAYTGGGEVIRTISSGIIPHHLFDLTAAVAVLISATLVLSFANFLGIPLSTSEVTVGAVIGVGLVTGGINAGVVGRILTAWAVFPFVVLLLAYVMTLCLVRPLTRWLQDPSRSKARGLVAGALIAGGCYEAFAAGMNNVANAVGPLVAAGILDPVEGRLLGGVCLGAGAVLFGGRVLETNGRKITVLTLASGVAVSFTAGSLVILSSMYGIPVPLTQGTTVAIIGSGLANYGRQGVDRVTFRRVALVWLLSPVVALMASYLTITASLWAGAGGLAGLSVILALLAVLLARFKWRGAGAVHPTAK